MARFRYRMQSILDIKLKLEESAKQIFAEKQAELNRQEQVLEEIIQRKALYEEERLKLLSGLLDFVEINENRNAIFKLDDLIAEQRVNVEKARKEMEKARAELTEIMQDRKAQESLKEKAFEAFLEEEKANESKEVDELTSYTYGKRRSTEG